MLAINLVAPTVGSSDERKVMVSWIFLAHLGILMLVVMFVLDFKESRTCMRNLSSFISLGEIRYKLEANYDKAWGKNIVRRERREVKGRTEH
ncbi:hypothetical protein VNO77_02569 [Canavalia gladiata]|uniref:Uncharacterized protein n=1 Tax=Canavalia gladiata TaxID=3824 RepID=A0AAN9MZQ6_CANGL